MSTESFLIALIFILPLVYVVLALIGKWNYFTLAISFISGLIIGGISIFVMELGFLIFPLLGWYIIYKSIIRTLDIEIEDGSTLPKGLKVLVILAVLLPLSYPLALLISLPISFVEFNLFEIIFGVSWYSAGPELQDVKGLIALLEGVILTIALIVSFYILYNYRFYHVADHFKMSKLNRNKSLLLGLGLLSSFSIFSVHIFSLLRG